MAITITFTEDYEGRRGGVSAGDTTASRRWTVVTSDASIGPPDIFAHADCPQYGDAWEAPGISDPAEVIDTDTGLLITQIALEPSPDSPKHWKLSATYSTRQDGAEAGGGASVGTGPGASPPSGEAGAIGEGAGGPPTAGDVSGEGTAVTGALESIPNPILRPAVLRVASVNRTRVVEWDKDALNPIRNSAGVPFDPPLTIEEPAVTFVITRNQAVFNLQDIPDYKGAINSATFLGLAAKTVRLMDLTADRQHENGIFYWSVTYSFEINADGWNPVKVLDQGYEENFVGDLVKITDKYGNPISRPALLDGSGLVLSDPQTDPPVLLSFNIYREVDFNDFNFW